MEWGRKRPKNGTNRTCIGKEWKVEYSEAAYVKLVKQCDGFIIGGVSEACEGPVSVSTTPVAAIVAGVSGSVVGDVVFTVSDDDTGVVVDVGDTVVVVVAVAVSVVAAANFV
ncbi:hypothetical protein V6N13_028123 [Hibiscus sabdariffa]